MKTFTTIACSLIAASIAAAPASAGTVIFNTWSTSTDGTDGIVRAFSGSGLNVKATAFSYNTSLSRAFLGDYGSAGLGVTNNGETGSGETHRVDNQSGNDFVVLVFDRDVNISAAVLNTYSGGDNDAFVSYAKLSGAYAMDWSTISLGNAVFGTLNTNGKNFEGNTSSGSLVNFNTSGAAGNVWVIGAARASALGYWDKNVDAFKIGSITVAAVPEPATWAMMIGGFGMVGYSMRRRRRVAVTFSAAA